MTPSPVSENRHTVRRLRTRSQLLEAARAVFAKKGVEAAAIADITEAADVGFGSFYNHFASKEILLEVLIRETIERHGAALDELTAPLTDAAEVLAVSVRHTVRMVDQDPVWGGFIVRVGLAHVQLAAGLGHRLRRDLRRGMTEDRFHVPNLNATQVAVGGIVLATMHSRLLGAVGKDAGDLAAEMVLRLLGVSEKEAAQVSRLPLPPLERNPS